MLIASLTTLAARRLPDEVSLGMLVLVTVTPLFGVILPVSEILGRGTGNVSLSRWARFAATFAAVTLGTGLLYAIIHASSLGPGVKLDLLMYEFYIAVGLAWLLFGVALVL